MTEQAKIAAKSDLKIIRCQEVQCPVRQKVPQSNRGLLSQLHNFYRQLDFSSQPGVANEFLENEPKSCLTVA